MAVRRYLRFGLSYRDVEELLAERGIDVDHVTVYRRVHRFAPLFADAARFARHAPGDRWFVEETCGDHLAGPHPQQLQCRMEEAAGRVGVPTLGHEYIDDLAMLVIGPVHVTPHSGDLDVMASMDVRRLAQPNHRGICCKACEVTIRAATVAPANIGPQQSSGSHLPGRRVDRDDYRTSIDNPLYGHDDDQFRVPPWRTCHRMPAFIGDSRLFLTARVRTTHPAGLEALSRAVRLGRLES